MDPKAIKIISLALITGIFSFLSFYFLNQGLILENIGNIWPAVVLFLLLIILVVLEVVFVTDLNLLISLVFIQSILSVLAFVNSFGSLNFILLSFAILFIFSVWGVKKGHSNIKNGLKINFFSTAHRVVPKVFTGILLFVVIIFYLNFIALGKFDENMGRRVFDNTANSLEPVLKIWAPDTSLDMKVGEALEKAAETQLQRSKIELLNKEGINLDEISPSRMEELVNQTALQIESRAEEVFGDLESDQTIREFTYTVIKEKVNNLSPVVKKLLAGFILLVFFFTVKGIAFFVYPILEFIAFLIYQILLMSGFAYISLETKQKEIINLS